MSPPVGQSARQARNKHLKKKIHYAIEGRALGEATKDFRNKHCPFWSVAVMMFILDVIKSQSCTVLRITYNDMYRV